MYDKRPRFSVPGNEQKSSSLPLFLNLRAILSVSVTNISNSAEKITAGGIFWINQSGDLDGNRSGSPHCLSKFCKKNTT